MTEHDIGLISKAFNNLILDDLQLIKSFPILLKYKKDIVYTPELVDYIIDKYTVCEDEDELLWSIPKDAFTREQYLRMFYIAVKDNFNYYSIPYLTEKCKEDFGIAMIVYESSLNYKFDTKTLSKAQRKKVVNMAIKKFNAKNLNKHYHRGLPAEIVESVIDYFIARPNKINFHSSYNLLEMLSYRQEVSIDKIHNFFNLVLEQYPEHLYFIYSNNTRCNIHSFIYEELIPNGKLQYIVDGIIKHFNIAPITFSRLNNTTNYENGIRLLVDILDRTERLSTNVYGEELVVYKESFVKYHLKQIFKIINNVFATHRNQGA